MCVFIGSWVTSPEPGARWWIIRRTEFVQDSVARASKWKQGSSTGHQSSIDEISSGYLVHCLLLRGCERKRISQLPVSNVNLFLSLEQQQARVPSRPDTWSWEGNVLDCTGEPVSVMRTKQHTNCELVLEWIHR